MEKSRCEKIAPKKKVIHIEKTILSTKASYTRSYSHYPQKK